jgi:hypothetical protein
MQLLQIVASATGTIPIIARTTEIMPTVPFQWVTVQNNGSNNMRFGDASTSSTKGILIAAGGSLTFGPAQHEGQNLNEWYIYIANTDTCDIMFQE